MQNCAKNLHVVLCMSPVGDVLRNRCRSFPGLVSSTTIDWVFPWPEEALFAVAKTFLAGHPKIPEMHREPIISHVVHVHNSIKFYSADFLQKLRRKNYVTPKHYLDYINTYIRLIGKSCVWRLCCRVSCILHVKMEGLRSKKGSLKIYLIVAKFVRR